MTCADAGLRANVAIAAGDDEVKLARPLTPDDDDDESNVAAGADVALLDVVLLDVALLESPNNSACAAINKRVASKTRCRVVSSTTTTNKTEHQSHRSVLQLDARIVAR